MDTLDFKMWLKENTSYSDRVISNITSRLKRADRIHSLKPTELYLFELEHTEEFKKMSQTVRSQVKKAVKLYMLYWESKGYPEVMK